MADFGLPDSAREAGAQAADAAEELSNTRTLDVLARFGFGVTGLLHILVGGIALAIAFGGHGDADPAGAVELLADSALGPVLMWAGFIGCAGLSLWQLSEATLRVRRRRRRVRVEKAISSGGLSIGYAGLALTFAGFALGRRSDSGESARDITASLLAAPFGLPLLIGIGVLVIGIGAYFVVKALRRGFKQELHFGDSKRGKLLTVLGVFGHIAKGVALGLVGLLIVIASVKHDPAESTGLDGSLKALRDHPYGVYVLTAVAAGFICYGIFAMIRARYGRM
ncbi:DUF1206 domain-containing protein [Arthrobacter sp. I2-34]|uniref:DUF1206 domain-containing protein n=1 Tax=Arthrobacter hankyongi TaxID=2904801 RepID=A0ABS9L350_9MICC|nr:DUF1206 domain-containing protein [Arthrobacter hankyongi]MCG2621070.1 DUF1206 domain-containing protein [Arthrobacter hankyongi]